MSARLTSTALASGRKLVCAAIFVTATPVAVSAQTPYLVKDVNPLTGGSSTPSLLTNVDGTVFFSANDAAAGIELWKSDGTEAGTVLVKDINPGSASSNPTSLISVGGTLYFLAGETRNQMWRSDGTAAGTVLVKAFTPTPMTTTIKGLINVDGTIFFSIIDTPFAIELWKSDGTAAGTVAVKEWTAATFLFGAAAFGKLLVFEVDDGMHGRELWKSDGSEAGTVLIKDINPGSASAFPNFMTDVNGTLFFRAITGAFDEELWKSDGTEAGTVLVKDINPGVGGSSPSYLIDVDGTLLFTANDGTLSFELWKSDGTNAGTVLVKDINPGAQAGSPQDLANVAGTLYFVADDGVHNRELWKSDGTPTGTVLVKDISPGSAHSFLLNLTNVNGTLFFHADDGTTGRELWRSEGTAPGTVLVKDINPGGPGSSPSGLAVVGSRLYFAADDGQSGREPWALLTQAVDLSVAKTDGQTTAVPGEDVTYTITVASSGPGVVIGATVADTLPASILDATWTCSASAGSTCTGSGSGSILDTVDLLPGGILTYVLHGTIDPSATGTLVNTVTVSGAGGAIDPNPANNIAVDTDTLTPQADFGIVVTDGQTVATPGASLVYTISVTHNGPSQSPAAMVTDSFPPVLTGVTWTCSATAGSSCGSPAGAGNIAQAVSLLPGGTATYAASAVLSPSATGTLVNTAAVAPPAGVADPVAANNADTDVDNVGIDLDGLEHGHVMTRSLATLPGPIAKQEYFWLSQSPYSSYEVVVDATSGDIGPGVVLERVGPDATTVLQSAEPVSGLGMSRSLRWTNTLPVSLESEFVRVRSAQCSTDCGIDDLYRIRAYETTYTIARFNNTGSQVTVLILQNPTSLTIAGTVHFWSVTGSLLASQPFNLSAKRQFVLNSATVPALVGLSGTITVASDGRYGELAGKAVALEPSTGFTFDSAMLPRPR